MARTRRKAPSKAVAVVDRAKPPVPDASMVTAPNMIDLSNQLVAPRRGTTELLKLYGEAPWMRAIVGKLARSVAEVDWHIFAKKGGDGKFTNPGRLARYHGDGRQLRVERGLQTGELAEIENHPLLDMFERGTGSARLNGYGVMQITQIHLDLVGEAFWLLERDQFGIPFAMWPLPPNWVRSLPKKDNPFYEVNAAGGTLAKIPMTEIIPFIDPDPSNPYSRGLGTADSLNDEVQIDEFAAKHQKSFFLNRARPDIIISGQFISKEDSKRLENQWLSEHQGFWKAFKPLFFSQKVDIKEITQTFESLQMTQVRKHERDTFISVFGVPPEKLGVIGDSKRSTIAAADFFWNKDLIKPRLERIRMTCQMVLVPQFDDRIVLDYETPVVQDDEFQLNVMKAQPGAYTLNEWRKAASQPSLGAQGEVMLLPANMIPVPAANLLEYAEEVSAPQEEPEDDSEDTADEEGDDAAEEEDKPKDDDKKSVRGKRRNFHRRVTTRQQIETDAIVDAVTASITNVLTDKIGALSRSIKSGAEDAPRQKARAAA